MIERLLVERTAELARLQLDEAEIEQMREDLSAILDYAEKMQSLALTAVMPTTHPVAIPSRTRPDIAHTPLSREQALAPAPARTDTGFLVPGGGHE